MRIVITGTPGTGKTTVGRKLSELLKYEYVNLNEKLVREGVCIYNDKLNTHDIIDLEKAEKIADKVLSLENVIIDTIALSIIDPDKVDIVIVLRLNPIELFKRLRINKGWKGIKLCSNVLAEALDYMLIEAIRCFGEEKVAEIDTTGRTVEDIVNECISIISGKKSRRIGLVSWLSSLDADILMRLDMCARGQLDDDFVLS